MKRNPAHDSQKLTPSDALLIENSFRVLQQQSGPAAERFFRELFSYDGGLKKKFAPDPWGREEALMGLLNRVVRCVQPGASIRAELNWVLRDHPSYIHSNYHHLYFGAALVAMLESTLGPQFKIVYAAWFKLFQLVVDEMRKQAATGAIRGESVEQAFAHPTAA